MTISSEIKAVLVEVGTPFDITKPDGSVIIGEDYLDDNSHVEHTNPAIRAFFIDFNTHYPTNVSVGDVVKWGPPERPMKIIVTSMAPELFAGEVVEYICSGYIVNTKGSFYTYNQEPKLTEENNFSAAPAWEEVYPGKVLESSISDRLYRSSVDAVANKSIEVENHSLQMFVSADFNKVKMGMQWRPLTGKRYKIDQIEENSFPGILSLFLSEETRP